MSIRHYLLSLMLATASLTAAADGWKAYMAYYDVQNIEHAGNIMFVQASDNLYSYNENDHSLQTYDKVSPLSDCGISMIKWNSNVRRLIIVYSNGNIDLMDTGGEVENISDYKSFSTTADKTINHIYIYGDYAYLAIGYGVMCINMRRAEISDIYNLGFSVQYTYVAGNTLYAASQAEGVYSAPMSANLLDKSNWTRAGSYQTAPAVNTDSLKQVVSQLGLSPGGPKYNYFGSMRYGNGRLYTVGGGYGAGFDLHREGCVQVLQGDNWTIYQDSLQRQTGHRYIDVMTVDYDPTNPAHVMAGGKTGLYEFLDGQFVREYTCDGSTLLQSAVTAGSIKDYVLVEALKFDGSGNLWLLNSQATGQSLIKYTADRQWQSRGFSSLYTNGRSLGAMQGAVFDSRGLFWIVNNHWTVPSLHVYQPSNGAHISWTSFTNEDGTSIFPNRVRCVAEADEGMWVGTNMGPLLLENSQIANDSSAVFTQVKVARNDGSDYADYLLDGVDVTCIAVDNANRKWFGTNDNGLYLISSDNQTQLHHFTASDSPLLSDNIESLAINSSTGEVYIGTDMGLCSYIGSGGSASGEMTKDNVWAYPNPVKPDYEGYINITGLQTGADVKIVTSNGTLVNEGTSLDGTYQWNGRDRQGRRVVSGVYMVMTATSDGEKGCVCKIAIIR